MKKYRLIFIVALVIISVVAIIVLENHLPQYKGTVAGFAIGSYLCYEAISIMIDSYRCKIKASAVLIDYGFSQFKTHIISSPIFSYQHNGKMYTESSREALAQGYVLKHYKEGQIYNIYISTKDPTCIKLTRRIRAFELVVLIIGLCIVALSICLLFL